MEKKDNKKTETFLLRLPKEQKEKIFKVVQKSSYNNASELIRAGIEKELNIQMNKDNMDFITKELSRLLDIKLDYFIKSQLKINSNNTRVNELNTYILGEVINLLTGDELYQKFLDILEKAKEDIKKEAEQEIIKLIGNQILDIERKWLNTKENYTNIKYTNESINLLDNILTLLYFQAENQKKYNKNFEMKHKKQLSKQAKKEYALRKANSSSFEWEDEM